MATSAFRISLGDAIHKLGQGRDVLVNSGACEVSQSTNTSKVNQALIPLVMAGKWDTPWTVVSDADAGHTSTERNGVIDSR